MLRVEMQQIKKQCCTIQNANKQIEKQCAELQAAMHKKNIYLIILSVVATIFFTLLITRDSDGVAADLDSIGEGGLSHHMIDSRYFYATSDEDSFHHGHHHHAQQQ